MPRLPFTFANLAITADGKIAPADRRFVPFSTHRDQELMMQLRARADAVMAGARTVDLGRVDLGPGGKEYQAQRIAKGLAEFNLRVIVSPTASVNPDAHIFKTRFSPIIILSSRAATKSRLARLGRVADDLFVSPGSGLDLAAALEWLRKKWKVTRLLCEGGGEINAPMFHHRLIDELYLTICPVLFGGRSAPTLADGEGIEKLAKAVPMKLKRIERVGDEFYTVFRVLK